MMLPFPSLRQTYDYDCGSKALQATMVYYGVEEHQDRIMETARTNKEAGTPIRGMLRVLEKHGLQYESRAMTIEEVKRFIDKKIPVILLLQAWKENDKDYKDCYDDDHYVVAIGYEENRIIFEDPSAFHRTYLSEEELLVRCGEK